MTGNSPEVLNALLANAFSMYASSLLMFSSVGGNGSDVGRVGISLLLGVGSQVGGGGGTWSWETCPI